MFERTRVKLTLWYLLIIMIISSMFSVAIYEVLTREVDRFSTAQRIRIERRLKEEFFDPNRPFVEMPISPMESQELVEEIKSRIIFFLLLVNGGIFIFAGALGYFLAGKTLKPIAQMLEEQNRFVADASHELKTPLTSLKSALEVYLRGKDRSVMEADKLVRESIQDVNKLQDLSENLLLLARNRMGHHKQIFSKLAIGEVIKKAVLVVRPIASSREISIKTSGKTVNVWGDLDSLVNLVVILLDNAVKYGNVGGVVSVLYGRNDGHVLIEVINRGLEIDKDSLPHIFDRFYRTDEARAKNGRGGYGLGLSIAKKIVADHGGSIYAKSKNGKTIFTVKLSAKLSKTI